MCSKQSERGKGGFARSGQQDRVNAVGPGGLGEAWVGLRRLGGLRMGWETRFEGHQKLRWAGMAGGRGVTGAACLVLLAVRFV